MTVFRSSVCVGNDRNLILPRQCFLWVYAFPSTAYRGRGAQHDSSTWETETETSRHWEGERERERKGKTMRKLSGISALWLSVSWQPRDDDNDEEDDNDRDDLILESGCGPCCTAFEDHLQINKDGRFSLPFVLTTLFLNGKCFHEDHPCPSLALIQVICNLWRAANLTVFPAFLEQKNVKHTQISHVKGGVT